jgi:hypothetical protein
MTIRDTTTGKTAQIALPKLIEKQAIAKANAAFAALGSPLRAE